MRATSSALPFVLVFFCATIACAQTLPDAPSAVGNRPAMAAVTVEPISPKQVPRPVEKTKVMDKKFMLLNGLVLATTVADMEFTQRCQDAGTCIEMNPTIPRERWAKHLVNVPTNAAVIYWSYSWKKEGKRLWWVPPLVDVGVHAVGLGSNLRFAF